MSCGFHGALLCWSGVALEDLSCVMVLPEVFDDTAYGM